MGKKVLIAEDYKDTREMMKFFLELDGYQVIVAADGYEAVEKAVTERPDLILMDIGMPVLDGVEAARAIREHETLARVPIVAVSAYADFYGEKARKAGCNAVLAKPLDLGKLQPIIRSYVSC